MLAVGGGSADHDNDRSNTSVIMNILILSYNYFYYYYYDYYYYYYYYCDDYYYYYYYFYVLRAKKGRFARRPSVLSWSLEGTGRANGFAVLLGFGRSEIWRPAKDHKRP